VNLVGDLTKERTDANYNPRLESNVFACMATVRHLQMMREIGIAEMPVTAMWRDRENNWAVHVEIAASDNIRKLRHRFYKQRSTLEIINLSTTNRWTGTLSWIDRGGEDEEIVRIIFQKTLTMGEWKMEQRDRDEVENGWINKGWGVNGQPLLRVRARDQYITKEEWELIGAMEREGIAGTDKYRLLSGIQIEGNNNYRGVREGMIDMLCQEEGLDEEQQGVVVTTLNGQIGAGITQAPAGGGKTRTAVVLVNYIMKNVGGLVVLLAEMNSSVDKLTRGAIGKGQLRSDELLVIKSNYAVRSDELEDYSLESHVRKLAVKEGLSEKGDRGLFGGNSD
jgi:hypothetical protein